VASKFTLNVIEKKKKSEKRHWRDLMGNVGEISNDLADAVQIDDENEVAAPELKLDSLLPVTAKEIGKVDPVGDFKKMLSSNQFEPEVSMCSPHLKFFFLIFPQSSSKHFSALLDLSRSHIWVQTILSVLTS
jgi:hypothetical protein